METGGLSVPAGRIPITSIRQLRLWPCGFDLMRAQLKGVGFAVLKKVLQGIVDSAKGQFIPGNLIFTEQANFQALATGIEILIQQYRAKHHVDLVYVGQAEDSV